MFRPPRLSFRQVGVFTIMIGALVFHLGLGDPPPKAALATVFLLLSCGFFYCRITLTPLSSLMAANVQLFQFQLAEHVLTE